MTIFWLIFATVTLVGGYLLGVNFPQPMVYFRKAGSTAEAIATKYLALAQALKERGLK